MAVVLLHGQYTTGDDYTDSQFRDFFHSMSTMSVFLVDQGNFVEVVEPALSVHGLYVMFFGVIAIFSMFFVSAILLTLFMDTYSAGSGGTLTPAQRRKWAALTLTHLLCARSILKPEFEEVALPGVFDQDAESKKYEEEEEKDEDMSPLMFEHLMLRCHLFSDMADSWIGIARELIQESISLLHRHKGNAHRHEAAALASVCCKLQFEKEYLSIVSEFPATDAGSNGTTGSGSGSGSGSGFLLHDVYNTSGIVPEEPPPRPALNPRSTQSGFGSGSSSGSESSSEQNSQADCFQANQEAILATALVKTGLCSNNLDEQVEFVTAALGEMSRDEAQTLLLNTSVPLLSVDDSDSEEQIRSVFCTALKVGVAQCCQPDVHIPKQQLWHAGLARSGNRYFQKVVNHCDLLQLVHQMYRVDIVSNDPLTQNISALIALVHMHIWRCRLLFEGLDINSGKEAKPYWLQQHTSLSLFGADGGLELSEFEKLWCFAKVSARMAASKLLQKEAEVMLLAEEVDTLRQQLQGGFTEHILQLSSNCKNWFIFVTMTKVNHSLTACLA